MAPLISSNPRINIFNHCLRVGSFTSSLKWTWWCASSSTIMITDQSRTKKVSLIWKYLRIQQWKHYNVNILFPHKPLFLVPSGLPIICVANLVSSFPQRQSFPPSCPSCQTMPAKKLTLDKFLISTKLFLLLIPGTSSSQTSAPLSRWAPKQRWLIPWQLPRRSATILSGLWVWATSVVGFFWPTCESPAIWSAVLTASSTRSSTGKTLETSP